MSVLEHVWFGHMSSVIKKLGRVMQVSQVMACQ